MTWYNYSIQSKSELRRFKELAHELQLKTLWSLDVKDGKYVVYIKGTATKVKSLLENYVVSKEKEEEDEFDLSQELNSLLEQIHQQKEPSDKLSAIRILVANFKRLADRKRIITFFTKEGKRKYVRKIGKIKGDTLSELTLQVCGDYRGLIVWDDFLLEELRELKV